MRALFNGGCELCGKFKRRCATLAVRGCNAYGDRETRVLTVCEDCRPSIRGRYTIHPKHKNRSQAS